jgi:protein-S-isoprenylcysteine O-methyltransferase Ste14
MDDLSGYGPQLWIYAPWVVWAVTWTIAGLWANRTEKRQNALSEAFYRIFTISGFALLLFGVIQDGQDVPRNFPSVLFQRYWTLPGDAGWAMVGLAALGFVFCWWARLHLGVLWSGAITRKEGHHVVDTGPYGLVRHPIYTGLLLAALATMILRGNLHAIIGFVLLVVGYTLKAKMEERFLRAELGAEAYDAYARRVPMLVPFAPV